MQTSAPKITSTSKCFKQKCLFNHRWLGKIVKNIQPTKSVQTMKTDIQHMENTQLVKSIQHVKNIQYQKITEGFQAIIDGNIFHSNAFREDIYFSSAKNYFVSTMPSEWPDYFWAKSMILEQPRFHFIKKWQPWEPIFDTMLMIWKLMCHIPVIALELLRIVMHNHVAWFFNRNVFFCKSNNVCQEPDRITQKH